MTTTEPRIYVACLASYNAGKLHGEWIDCEGLDDEDLGEAVNAMLAKSPIPRAEEYAIHDHEGFSGFDVGEFSAMSEVAAMVALLDEHGDVARAAAKLVVNDLDQIRDMCEQHYCGQFDDLGCYAESALEGQIDLPAQLAYYFDYDSFGRDMELSGDISTVRVGGELHIFDNH